LKKGFFLKICVCILFLGGCLYSYIDTQNAITSLRIKIPHLTAELRKTAEENMRLLYEIEEFESPENLMKLAQNNAYAYLKYPHNQEVMTLTVAEAETAPEISEHRKSNITFATGITR